MRVKESIIYCSRCFNITETDPCPTCSNPSRDQEVICVVEEPRDEAADTAAEESADTAADDAADAVGEEPADAVAEEPADAVAEEPAE